MFLIAFIAARCTSGQGLSSSVTSLEMAPNLRKAVLAWPSRYEMCWIKDDVLIRLSASLVANPERSDSSWWIENIDEFEFMVVLRRQGR